MPNAPVLHSVQLNDLPMKSLLFVLAGTACILFSCTKDTQTEPAYTGDTQMMACFNRIGIKTFKGGNQDSVMYIIPDNLDSKFAVEGKKLEFDAELRANTLVPTFPDPSVDASSVFQGKVSNVREKTQ